MSFGTYELQTTFGRLTREIPDLGLCSGYYAIEGSVEWSMDEGVIHFDGVDIVVTLLPEDDEEESDLIVWEWRSDVVHADKMQNTRDQRRALEILETFGDADAGKARQGYTIADMIRESIESDDPDVNYVLRMADRW